MFCRLLEAHAVAYDLVHRLVPRAPDGGPTMVGYANAYQAVEPYHEHGPRRSLEAVASRIVSWVSFDAWDHAVRTGLVPAPMGLGRLGPRIRRLAGTADFVGVNYYMRISVRLNPSSLSNVKSGEYDAPPGIETTEMGWQVYPPGFRSVLNRVSDRVGLPIYITENGCSATDVPAADGLVYDTDRIMFLRSYLTQLQRATSEGVPVRGYFHWSLMDNFEWADGFGTRFGLLYVDYATQQRTPKLSASFYREVAVRNRLA